MQEGKSTAQFVPRVEQARRAAKASSVYVYHTFFHKLEESMQLLLDNVHVKRRANGHDPVTWEDMVAICRDQLAGVLLAVMNAALMVALGKSASVQVTTASFNAV